MLKRQVSRVRKGSRAVKMRRRDATSAPASRHSLSPADADAELRRRGFWLEYASMAWMTVEAAVAVAAGVIVSSVALVGFGLDSVIEFCAAIIIVWQLRGSGEERVECGHLNWPRFGFLSSRNFGPAWVVISPGRWARLYSSPVLAATLPI